MMKTTSLTTIVLVLSGLVLTSCEVVGTIFNAGVYTGIFIVVFVIVLIIFFVVRAGKRD